MVLVDLKLDQEIAFFFKNNYYNKLFPIDDKYTTKSGMDKCTGLTLNLI